MGGKEHRQRMVERKAAERAKGAADLQRADDLWFAAKQLARGEITQAEFDQALRG